MNARKTFELAYRSARAFHYQKQTHRAFSPRTSELLLFCGENSAMYTEEEYSDLISIPNQIWTAAKTAVRDSKAVDETTAIFVTFKSYRKRRIPRR